MPIKKAKFSAATFFGILIWVAIGVGLYFRFRKKESVSYDSVLECISSLNEIRVNNTAQNKAYKWLNDDTVVSSPSDSFLV